MVSEESVKKTGLVPEVKKLFENLILFTTKEAAAFLKTTPNAIRIRVHRKQLTPLKPFGSRGMSYFKLTELNFCLAASDISGGSR